MLETGLWRTDFPYFPVDCSVWEGPLYHTHNNGVSRLEELSAIESVTAGRLAGIVGFFPSLSWFRPFLEIVFLYGLLAGLVFDLVLGSYFFPEVHSFGWTWWW
jgi:hypothetical protein